MSIGTMQAFYHLFWRRFVDEMKPEWIKYPKTAAEAVASLDVYRRLGFPGAFGSIDCTHVHWLRCPAGLQSGYTGKEKIPTISFEVTTNHQKEIMFLTPGITLQFL